jgi:hypothetical protein
MTNSFVTLQADLAQALKASLATARADSAGLVLPPPLGALLNALVDALPYLGNAGFEQALRGAFANLMETNMLNGPIVSYQGDYRGSYNGLQNAFFGQVGATAAARAVALQAQAVVPALDANAWGHYGVTVLTDAIRATGLAPLNTGKLAADLASGNASLQPALAASCVAIHLSGYAPTMAVYAQIGAQSGAAAQMLAAALTQPGEVSANINRAIAVGGDSASAATWFLFNLWVALRALGSTTVDATIAKATAAGLKVPGQVGPGQWWSGGYTDWWAPLTGADVAQQAMATINADFPVSYFQHWSHGGGKMVYGTVPHGYVTCLCDNGNLNWYSPQGGSCFGRGTKVLMADGHCRSIEDIALGEQVRCGDGQRPVVLVSTPRRTGRPLYRINGQAVWATGGHPFHNAEAVSGRCMAVDPWAAVDGVPTLAETGVGALAVGSTLRARVEEHLVDVPVHSLTAEQGADDEERVYNLYLQGWEQCPVGFFVGGPEQFFSTETEVNDATADLPTTAAILAALRTSLEPCRLALPQADEGLELHRAIQTLRPGRAQAGPADTVGDVPADALPRLDADLLLRNGRWDAHASIISEHLVRCHARALRRLLNSPLQAAPTPVTSASCLALVLHDIEWLGVVQVLPGEAMTLNVRVRGLDADLHWTGSKELPADAPRAWFRRCDCVIEIGEVAQNRLSGVLDGFLVQSGRVLGRFRCGFDDPAVEPQIGELGLWHPRAGMVGRIAVGLACVPAPADGASAFSSMSRADGGPEVAPAIGRALAMGRRLGQQLVTTVARGAA